MNNWTSGYCYSPTHTLHRLQSLLFGALLSTGFLTEHLKWDRERRGVWGGGGLAVVEGVGGHRCYWVALLLKKNDLCLRMPPLSVFRASCNALVPSFIGGYHAGRKTFQSPRWWTAGVPPNFTNTHTHTHTLSASEVLPPWVCLRCSFAHMPSWKHWLGHRDGICSALDGWSGGKCLAAICIVVLWVFSCVCFLGSGSFLETRSFRMCFGCIRGP